MALALMHQPHLSIFTCFVRHLRVQQSVAILTGGVSLYEMTTLEKLCSGESEVAQSRRDALNNWLSPTSLPVLEQWAQSLALMEIIEPGDEISDFNGLWSLLKLVCLHKRHVSEEGKPTCYCLPKAEFCPFGCPHQQTKSKDLHLKWCPHCAVCQRCNGHIGCN